MNWQRPFLRVGLIVFLANGGLSVLQLISSRLLSPYIGSSLSTWTTTIGVFLTGISLGNALGGRLADRSPTGATLARLLALGAVSTLWMWLVVAVLGDGRIVQGFDLNFNIVVLTFVLGLPVSTLLSLITPVAIRILLPDLGRSGAVVGLIYALGTLGSLVGTFVTGYFLVDWFQTTTIVASIAGLLIAMVPLCKLGALVSTAVSAQPVERAVRQQVSVPQSTTPSLSLGLACALVAMTSFITMSLELSASRLLAPVIGVSLQTWTGIIGVVLAGMAVGNQVGGFLADWKPSLNTLGTCLLAGGFAVLTIILTFSVVNKITAFDNAGLGIKVVAYAFMIFFAPMVLLGTISPQVTRLAMTNVQSAGRTAGTIYACSCAGAIVGTFATGWFLISLLTVMKIFILASLALFALSLFVVPSAKNTFWLYAAGILVGAAGAGLLVSSDSLVPRSGQILETNYYTIRVSPRYLIDTKKDEYILDENEERIVKFHALDLDHLTHSYVRIDDPTYLGYEHEIVQAELTQLAAWRAEKRGDKARYMVIGGGGYTLPRWISHELRLPIDVVEIDPGVTQMVRDHMGLDPDTYPYVHPIHQDGRQVVTATSPKTYDLVIQDAVNDLSVPYHILTKEYNDRVASILKPGGEYLLTVIDEFDKGELMRSLVRTMQKTFPSVQLMGARELWKDGYRHVYVIRGAQQDLDLGDLKQALQHYKAHIKTEAMLIEELTPKRVAQDKTEALSPSDKADKKSDEIQVQTKIMPPDDLDQYARRGRQIILTDRFAPVDQLMAPVFANR